MRVLETKVATTGLTMGKKKHRIRKQNRENSQFQSDSSDDSHATGVTCKHTSKAVNFNVVKKTIKQQSCLGSCKSCDQQESPHKHNRNHDDTLVAEDDITPTTITPPAGDDDNEEEVLVSVWMCLQCGHQGCGRASTNQHALRHYQTPHSVSHSLAVNMDNWVIWCYDCDSEVPAVKKHNLKGLIEVIRKQCDQQTSGGQRSMSHTQSTDTHSYQKDTTMSSTVSDMSQKFDKINIFNKSKSATAMPKVKGLSNLGNTCFFNAVMQILSQTSVLEVVLSEQSKKGVSLSLSSKQTSDSEPCCSDSSCEEMECSEQINPLTITLPESGALTQSLLTFLREMNSSSKNHTISPSSLFRQICNKAPRFKGFHEQDSHELLRHLLDGMKAEEIKRSKGGILKSFKLSENTNPKVVDEDTKCKIKVYGKQSKHTFVDSIFGGYFISTVLCEECHHPSQIFEPFQDISLPIAEEKPIRPNNIFPGRRNDEKHIGGAGDGPQEDEKLNKYQQKKAKRLAKKDSKKRLRAANKNKVEPAEDKVEPLGDTGVKSALDKEMEHGSDWDSKSDADIEDNLESDASRTHLTGDNTSAASTSTTLGRAPIGDISETDKISTSSGSTNSVDINEARDCLENRLMGQGSNHLTDDRKDSGIDSVADSLSTLSLNGHDSVKSYGCGGGSCSSSSIGAPPGGEEDYGTLMETNVMAMSTASAETDEGVSISAYQRRLDAKNKAMSTLASKRQAVLHECSVASCLNQFTAPELLTGNNKFGCAKCTATKFGKQSKEGKRKVYTNANKQVLVFSPPAVLTLHLKRFQQVGMSLRKVNRHVDFPLVLDLAPYCSALSQRVHSGQQQVLYSLYGVVEHSGRLSSGHYTAYVKTRPNPSTSDNKLLSFLQTHSLPHALRLQDLYEQHNKHMGEKCAEKETVPTIGSGKWFHISDSNVAETSESHVLRCQAYMLFYERVL